MNELADFLVKKRLWLLIASILAVAACIVLMQFVTVNEDMTQYLPEDSSMRIGLDIMESEFPSATQEETFKLMFENLDEGQKQVVEESHDARRCCSDYALHRPLLRAYARYLCAALPACGF